MKITIENEYAIATIETKDKGEDCYDALQECRHCLLALGYHHQSIERVICEMADEIEESDAIH